MALTPSNAFPNAAYPQHGSGNTTTVQSYIYPGAVQPNSTTPTVLTTSEALPAGAFPQHGSGQTATVRSYIFPGAVLPVVSSSTSHTQTLTETVTNTDTKVSVSTRPLIETITNSASLIKNAGKVLLETLTNLDTVFEGKPVTYYFDGHTSISDPGSVWTNDANAFDGTLIGISSASESGNTSSKTSNYLGGIGVSSPTAGGAISLVRIRGNAETAFGVALYMTVFSNSIELNTVVAGGDTSTWGTWVDVTADAPSGGWTWDKVRELEIRFHFNGGDTSGQSGSYVGGAQIEITYAGSTYTQALTEALTNTDALIRATAHSLVEAITNSDTLTHVAALSRTLTEMLSNTATAIKTGARNLTEAITNTATTLKTAARTFPENLTNTDTFSKVLSYARSFTETLTNADTFIRTTARNFVEAITNSDVFAGSKGSALTSGLVSYWKLDEASGNAADSVGSNTLTNNNSVAYASGKINNGATFVGASSQYLSNASAIGYSINVPMTYNFWVNLSSTSNKGVFIEDSGNGGISNGFAVGVGSGTLDTVGNNLIIPFWGVDWQDTGVSIGTGWHMITIIIDSNRKATAYLDATSVFTGTSVMGVFANSPFLIGRSNYSTSYRYFTDGYVDETGVWSRALTSTEVSSLYNSGAGNQYPFGSIFTQALTEAITNTDAFIRSGIRTLTETLTNTATAVKAGGRSLLEAITNTDTFSSLKATAKTLSDAVTSTDALIRAGARTLSETITNTATLIRSATRGLIETITNTATLVRTTGRSLVETLSLADAFTTISSKGATLAEAVTNSDTFIRLQTAFRTFSETLTNSDIFASIGGLNVTLSEIITTTDSLIRAATKNFVETITNTATLTRNLVRGLTETLTNTASLIANKFVGSTLSETLSATDALIKTAGRVLLEALSNMDSFIGNKALSRVYTETITNTATALRGAAHALVETITQSDTFTRALMAVRTLTETITQSDSAIKLVNGLVVIWTHITKSTDAAWSHSAKATDAVWSKISKATTSWLHINKS